MRVDMPYTIMVVGSRGWTDENVIRRGLIYYNGHGARLIHGAAKSGADAIADRVGRELGYAVEPFPPDKSLGFPACLHIRNDAMLDERPNVVLAFWDGLSTGTRGVIEKAARRGLTVRGRVYAGAS